MASKIIIEVPKDSGSLGAYSVVDNIISFSLQEDSKDIIGQWFFFNIKNNSDYRIFEFVITNSDKSQYPKGWNNYRPVYTDHNGSWGYIHSSRINNEGKFVFTIQAPPQEFSVAWYEPYSLSRLNHWIESISSNDSIFVTSTLLDSPCIRFGIPTHGTFVLIARQHPGETMSSFFIEGIIEEIGRTESSSIKPLFELIIFPMINPGGVFFGKHRYTREGLDLNRLWLEHETVPEIKQVIELLHQCKNIQCFIDIHGDEVTNDSPHYIDIENTENLSKTQLSMFSNFVRFLISNSNDLEIYQPHQTFKSTISKIIHPWRYFQRQTQLNKTSARFVSNNFSVPSMTYEIKAHQTSSKDCADLGRSFIKAIIELGSHLPSK